jgi:hypothetical protein
MSTLREDLTLERLAVATHEEDADRYWRSCNFGLAAECRALADEARARVRELEQEMERR